MIISYGYSVFSLPVFIAFAGLMSKVHQYLFLSLRGTLRASDFNCSGSIVTSMKACLLHVQAFVNFVLLTSVSILQPCFKIVTSVDSCVFLGTIVHCSIAVSYSLLASPYRSEQFTEKLELGWGLSAEKRGGWAHLLQSASCTRWSHQFVHPMLKQGQCKGFLAEKQKSSSLSEQDIFKNKTVAKACCFYRYTSCLRQPMKSAWDLISQHMCIRYLWLQCPSSIGQSPRDMGHYNTQIPYAHVLCYRQYMGMRYLCVIVSQSRGLCPRDEGHYNHRYRMHMC